jgi:hypothetical protein
VDAEVQAGAQALLLLQRAARCLCNLEILPHTTSLGRCALYSYGLQPDTVSVREFLSQLGSVRMKEASSRTWFSKKSLRTWSASGCVWTDEVVAGVSNLLTGTSVT